MAFLKNLFVVFASLFFACTAFAEAQKIDGLYVNTFGKATDPSVIFIHGGPGINSYDFELTSAANLAARGYYVVVYDERGQGRSDAAPQSDYNYKRYADDLKEIIDTLQLKSPALLGHSHGGAIAVKFDQYYPGVARKIVLVSAPLDMWGALHSIFDNCTSRLQAMGDEKDLGQVLDVYNQLFLTPNPSFDQMVTNVSNGFGMAFACGLYMVKQMTPEAQKFFDLLNSTPLTGTLTGGMEAMPGFLANENYVHVDLIDQVTANRDRYCGLFGDEDGLFTPLTLAQTKNALQKPGEPNRFQMITGSSHHIYIFQQTAFFDALKNTCGI